MNLFKKKQKEPLAKSIRAKTEETNNDKYSDVIKSIHKAANDGHYFVAVIITSGDIDHFSIYMRSQGFILERREFNSENFTYRVIVSW
jgi:3-dehydroquinate dehydratase